MSRPRYTDPQIAELAKQWSGGEPCRIGDFALHIFAPMSAISPQCMQIRRAILTAGGSVAPADKRTDEIFTIGTPADKVERE
jgi:hypothetical protein